MYQTVLLILFSLCLSLPSYGGNGFRLIENPQQAPEGRFIFFIYDWQEEKIYFGYATDQDDPANKDEPIRGLRNGGHVKLASSVFGLESLEDLDRFNPDGEGRLVGGGVVLDEQGNIRIHPYNSLKANGRTPNLQNFINPRLEYGDFITLGGIIPDYYGPKVFNAVATFFNRPLFLENSLVNSPYFKFNADGSPGLGEDSSWQSYRKNVAYWLPRVVADINARHFGRPLDRKKIALDAIKAGAASLDYNWDLVIQYVNSPEGETLLRQINAKESPLPTKEKYSLLEQLVEVTIDSPEDLKPQIQVLAVEILCSLEPPNPLLISSLTRLLVYKHGINLFFQIPDKTQKAFVESHPNFFDGYFTLLYTGGGMSLAELIPLFPYGLVNHPTIRQKFWEMAPQRGLKYIRDQLSEVSGAERQARLALFDQFPEYVTTSEDYQKLRAEFASPVTARPKRTSGRGKKVKCSILLSN